MHIDFSKNSGIININQDMDIEYFNEKKEKAKTLFCAQKSVHNPYLDCDIIFNSDGFHHLQFSARRERKKEEQLLKFNLLPLAIKIIKKSGTLQEYRKNLIAVGKKAKDGLAPMKQVEYYGFFAIVGESQIRVRTIIRRVGDGNFIFWSVLPHSKLKNGQKIYADGIEDE